jgi:general secretion pathway protein G
VQPDNPSESRGLLASVLAVVLLLAVATLVAVAVSWQRPRFHSGPAPMAAARTQISTFQTVLDAYRQDTGNYPAGTNGLQALVRQPPDATNWHGPYLEHIPKDPWGHDYLYAFPGQHGLDHSYDISSLGPPGGGAAIDNWSGPMVMEAAMIQMTLIEKALKAFQHDTGSFPQGTNGLLDLVRQPPASTNWHGPYLRGIPNVDYFQLQRTSNWLSSLPILHEIPKDPWGNAYIYNCPGEFGQGYPYDLISQGPPGKNSKIANWQFKMTLP